MRYLLAFLILLCATSARAQWDDRLAPVPSQQAQFDRAQFDRAQFDSAAIQTREGLDEDYRLAELLIARTAQRRAEAMRLQMAAAQIEFNNARLREFMCSRFCQPTTRTQFPIPFPAQPMFPAQRELDPALYPQPLPYTQEAPARVQVDANVWRSVGNGGRGMGTFNVQVLPR